MTTPTPTAKPMPLTAQATLAHYQREAAHAAELADLQRAKARIAELEAALQDVLRIATAIRYTVSLGKSQLERIDSAAAVLTAKGA